MPVLFKTRVMIEQAAGGDGALAFALRRYVYARLEVDERGTSMQRKKRKEEKRREQSGNCPLCGEKLPDANAVLDRVNGAMAGYTMENTRVLCPRCDDELQRQRGYA